MTTASSTSPIPQNIKPLDATFRLNSQAQPEVRSRRWYDRILEWAWPKYYDEQKCQCLLQLAQKHFSDPEIQKFIFEAASSLRHKEHIAHFFQRIPAPEQKIQDVFSRVVSSNEEISEARKTSSHTTAEKKECTGKAQFYVQHAALLRDLYRLQFQGSNLELTKKIVEELRALDSSSKPYLQEAAEFLLPVLAKQALEQKAEGKSDAENVGNFLFLPECTAFLRIFFELKNSFPSSQKYIAYFSSQPELLRFDHAIRDILSNNFFTTPFCYSVQHDIHFLDEQQKNTVIGTFGDTRARKIYVNGKPLSENEIWKKQEDHQSFNAIVETVATMLYGEEHVVEKRKEVETLLYNTSNEILPHTLFVGSLNALGLLLSDDTETSEMRMPLTQIDQTNTASEEGKIYFSYHPETGITSVCEKVIFENPPQNTTKIPVAYSAQLTGASLVVDTFMPLDLEKTPPLREKGSSVVYEKYLQDTCKQLERQFAQLLQKKKVFPHEVELLQKEVQSLVNLLERFPDNKEIKKNIISPFLFETLSSVGKKLPQHNPWENEATQIWMTVFEQLFTQAFDPHFSFKDIALDSKQSAINAMFAVWDIWSGRSEELGSELKSEKLAYSFIRTVKFDSPESLTPEVVQEFYNRVLNRISAFSSSSFDQIVLDRHLERLINTLNNSTYSLSDKKALVFSNGKVAAFFKHVRDDILFSQHIEAKAYGDTPPLYAQKKRDVKAVHALQETLSTSEQGKKLYRLFEKWDRYIPSPQAITDTFLRNSHQIRINGELLVESSLWKEFQEVLAIYNDKRIEIERFLFPIIFSEMMHHTLMTQSLEKGDSSELFRMIGNMLSSCPIDDRIDASVKESLIRLSCVTQDWFDPNVPMFLSSSSSSQESEYQKIIDFTARYHSGTYELTHTIDTIDAFKYDYSKNATHHFSSPRELRCRGDIKASWSPSDITASPCRFSLEMKFRKPEGEKTSV